MSSLGFTMVLVKLVTSADIIPDDTRRDAFVPIRPRLAHSQRPVLSGGLGALDVRPDVPAQDAWVSHGDLRGTPPVSWPSRGRPPVRTIRAEAVRAGTGRACPLC